MEAEEPARLCTTLVQFLRLVDSTRQKDAALVAECLSVIQSADEQLRQKLRDMEEELEAKASAGV